MNAQTILLGEGNRSLRRSFRAVFESRGYGVIEAVDGLDAVALINRHRPDVAVLDAALTGVDGVQVCERLKADSETAEIPVLMIGTRPDRDTVVRSLRAGASDFVVKTGVSVDLLTDRVARLLAAGGADASDGGGRRKDAPTAVAKTPRKSPSGPTDKATIERKIEQIAEAKALPFLASEIISMTADRGSSAKDLVKLIERDQAVTAKLLKLANSSYFTAQGRSTSISHAVSKIGFNGVREMVLGMVLIDDEGAQDGSHLDKVGFWRHSLGVAALTEMLSKAAGAENSESVLVAGLLHDIGKAVADDFLNEAYGEALRRAREEGQLLRQAEKDVMGMDHSQIGARIAKKWRLPEYVFGPIAYHHKDWEAVLALPETMSPKLVGITKLADILVHAKGHGVSGEEMIELVPEGVCKKLGLTAERVEKVLGGLDGRLKELEQIFMLYEEPYEDTQPCADAGGAELLLLSKCSGASSLEVLLRSCGFEVTRSESLPVDLLESPPAVVVFEAAMASDSPKIIKMLGEASRMPRLVAVGASLGPVRAASDVLAVLPAPFPRHEMIRALGLVPEEVPATT